MRKEIHQVICQCDVCRKEVENLTSVKLPARHFKATDYQGFGKWSDRLHIEEIELCDECLKKLNEIILKEFAVIYSEDYCEELTIKKVEKKKKKTQITS